MKKKFQILYKGIYTNELSIFETTDFKIYKEVLFKFKQNIYDSLILLQTNISDQC